MDRLRMLMSSLLAGAALLHGAAACAQGHDPSGAAQRVRQQRQDTPEERFRQIKERQAWLQRLVGRFHAQSTESRYQYEAQRNLAEPDAPSTTTYNSRITRTQGRAECVSLETENGVSCLLDLKTRQGAGSVTAFRVTLPPPDASSLVRPVDGRLYMGMVQASTWKWESLEGNTAIFKAECRKVPRNQGRRASASTCGQRVRITARPDGTRVQVLIESGGLRSTHMDLNRARIHNAG